MKKQILLAGCYFLIAVLIFSCKKENGVGTATFLGKWEASYGETIVFSQLNGKYMVKHNMTMNPSMPTPSYFEYTYRHNKLGIKDGLSGLGDFRFFQTFRWLEEGRSFEIQGSEWYPFLSSAGTYFTFTKIQ